MQSTGQADLTRELMSNLGCIFEAHLPDLNDVIKKQSAASAEEGKDDGAARTKPAIVMRPITMDDSTKTNSKVMSLFKNLDG